MVIVDLLIFGTSRNHHNVRISLKPIDRIKLTMNGGINFGDFGNAFEFGG
jgi:hypothetical protein